MTIWFPEETKVQGANKIAFGLTAASMTAPSLATDVVAASSVEATQAMYGQWAPPVNVNTGQSPVRIGTTTQMPQEGNVQLQVIPAAYPWDPSADDEADDNALKALLTEGTEVYAFVRKGTDIDTPFAVGDLVDVWHLRCGYQNTDSTTGTDEFATYQVAQNLIPLEPKVRGTLVA